MIQNHACFPIKHYVKPCVTNADAIRIVECYMSVCVVLCFLNNNKKVELPRDQLLL